MRISWLSILQWFSTSAFANHQTMTLVLAAQNDNGHAYYRELLARALADHGISSGGNAIYSFAADTSGENGFLQSTVTHLVIGNSRAQ